MIEIRKALLEDLKTVSILFDKYRVFYEKESDLNGAEKFVSEQISNSDSVIYIALDESKNILGFVQLYPLFASTKIQRLWQLNDLFVDEKSRGNGVSKQLIEASKKLCSEANASGLAIKTAQLNDIGNSLYPSAGFTLNKGHNYYSWDR